MYVLATNMWFSSLMRQFFFWIDKIVFNFISSIYDVLIAIARTSVFTQSDFAEMTDRIYKLLAVFMVFKVTLSLITYVVNPDNFTEKSKGVYKLSTNIIISLAMLILTPYIFSYAYQVQTILLEDNSLGVLIFGGENDNSAESVFNTAGDKIAYTAMTPFFTPNLSLVSSCSNLLGQTDEDGNGKIDFNYACSGWSEGKTNEDGTLYGLIKNNEKNFSEQTLRTYVAGVEHGNLGLMFRQDMALATANDNTEFVMDYKFIFSTATGIIIVLLLITFCMDIGVRSIKLAFFQLIAPVPIISYIDPKKGKDGMFKKWAEMCFKTYLSLFVRLVALYFAVFIINKVADRQLVDIVDGSYVNNAIIYVFIIIGALMFAKQLPEILKGLGIKLDGDGKFTLNPLRKMENNMLGGKLLKKPNDLLAKGAKGLMKAPVSGLALAGKKTIAGIDSASHGKGFWNGTKNAKSKLAQSRDKFMEKNLPHTNKTLKDRKEGRENIKLKDKQEMMGAKYFDPETGKMDSKAMLNDVNEKYKKSWLDVSQKKADMYKAQAQAEAGISAIKDGKLTGENRNKLARQLGFSEEEIKNGVADSELIQKLQKYSGTAEKQFKEAEARHAEMKKQNPKSAEIEAAYDYYEKMYANNFNIDKIEIESDNKQASQRTSINTQQTTQQTPINGVDGQNQQTPTSMSEGTQQEQSVEPSAQNQSSTESEYSEVHYRPDSAWQERIDFAEDRLQELVNESASTEEIREQNDTVNNLHREYEKSKQAKKELDASLDEIDDEFNDSWMSQGRADNSDDAFK